MVWFQKFDGIKLMDLLRRCDLIEVPWKNGGGTTREIAAGKIDEKTAWRPSRAGVDQDSAFSEFAGLTRILTVVSGGGMVLKHAGGMLDADLWRPVQFDGSLKILSQLRDGPLTDLNLMFDPTNCVGEVVLNRGPSTMAVASPKDGTNSFHVLSGKPSINATRLGLGDTAFVKAKKAILHLDPGDALLEIRLTYLPQSSAIKLCIVAR